MNLRSPAPKAGAIAKLRYTSMILNYYIIMAVKVALVALLQMFASAHIARFVALPQARFICRRQRSLSSPKAGAIAKLRYTSMLFTALLF